MTAPKPDMVTLPRILVELVEKALGAQGTLGEQSSMRTDLRRALDAPNNEAAHEAAPVEAGLSAPSTVSPETIRDRFWELVRPNCIEERTWTILLTKSRADDALNTIAIEVGARTRDLEAALVRIQWGCHGSCPECYGQRPDFPGQEKVGHFSDCSIGLLIAPPKGPTK